LPAPRFTAAIDVPSSKIAAIGNGGAFGTSTSSKAAAAVAAATAAAAAVWAAFARTAAAAASGSMIGNHGKQLGLASLSDTSPTKVLRIDHEYVLGVKNAVLIVKNAV
jgi:hypothetical protein